MIVYHVGTTRRVHPTLVLRQPFSSSSLSDLFCLNRSTVPSLWFFLDTRILYGLNSFTSTYNTFPTYWLGNPNLIHETDHSVRNLARGREPPKSRGWGRWREWRHIMKTHSKGHGNFHLRWSVYELWPHGPCNPSLTLLSIFAIIKTGLFRHVIESMVYI